MSGGRFDRRVYQALKRPNLAMRKSLQKLIALCCYLEKEMPSSEMRDTLKFKLDELNSTLPPQEDDEDPDKDYGGDAPR